MNQPVPIEFLRKIGASAAVIAANSPVAPPVVVEVQDAFRQPTDAFVGLEKLLHRDFKTDMERRGVHCVHARTDTESSIEVGLPDFHLMFRGQDGICRSAAVEFKVAGGRVKPSQREKIAEMRQKRIPVIVAWNLASAIAFARQSLGC